MKTFFLLIILFSASFANAQTSPVKWATQETFFEELVGKGLPDFKGIDVNTKPFLSSSLEGKIVVINFWFEACPPCVKEIPELNILVEKYGKDGVKFIAITYDLSKQAKKFQKQSGYKYEIVSLTNDEISKLNINHGYPSNILIGKDGKIIKAISTFSFNNEIPSIKQQTLVFEEKIRTEITNTASRAVQINVVQ